MSYAAKEICLLAGSLQALHNFEPKCQSISSASDQWRFKLPSPQMTRHQAITSVGERLTKGKVNLFVVLVQLLRRDVSSRNAFLGKSSSKIDRRPGQLGH